MLNDDELQDNYIIENIINKNTKENNHINNDIEEGIVSLGSEDEIESDIDDDDGMIEGTAIKRKQINEKENDLNDISSKKQKLNKNKNSRTKNKGLQKYTKMETYQLLINMIHRVETDKLKDEDIQEVLKEENLIYFSHFGKHSPTQYCRFIRASLPTWRHDLNNKHPNETYSPKVIIISSSAIRAVQLLKLLKEFKCSVAKLFGKHIKIDEQKSLLRQKYYPLAVATPIRLNKLIELDALSISNISVVIIDMERNKKEMNILEDNESAKAVSELILNGFSNGLKQNKLKIGLF